MNQPPSVPGGGDRNGGEDGLGIDRVLDILNHPVRRGTLTFCEDVQRRAVHVDELVDHLLDERNQSRDTVIRERVRTELYHHHLPKLAEANVIEFDPRSKQFRYRGDERLETWLDRVRNEPPV